jgi:predicted small metal-binding protein
MARKFVDCREFGGDCTVMISADNAQEVEDAAIDHAVKRHQEQDTPEFRTDIRKSIKEEVTA